MRGPKGKLRLVLPVLILAAGALAWLGFRTFGGASTAAVTGKFYPVAPMDMDVRIIKDGEIQSANNIDILCEVEGMNTIQELVKEGSSVKKGDVLLVMDSSSIKLRLEDTSLDLERAEADLTTGKEMIQIQESQNAANLEAAQIGVTLAKLDLEQYTDGVYPQQLANAETDLKMADITLKNRQEDLDQATRLFAKGFVTGADVKKAELDVTNALNAVSKAQTAVHVLTKFTNQMDLTAKKSELVQTERRLLRTQRENASNLAYRTADLRAKQQALSLQKRRLAHLQEQLASCTIKAPADGMVVYASTFDRNSQGPIQEGATIRERQLLFRLPDTSSMKAVVRIQEAMVSKLAMGQRATVKIVGVPDQVGASLEKISVLADSSQRWWNPDLKEYPVDLTLDQTPPGLKPGTGALVEIFINHLTQVLGVPLDCIYSAGDSRYVFVRDGDQVRPLVVKVGASTETHAEMTSGLSAGQEILRLQTGQGRELLEKAGIKPPPTSQPAAGPHRRGKRAE